MPWRVDRERLQFLHLAKRILVQMNGTQSKHVFCVHNDNSPKSVIAVCLWTTRMNDYEGKNDHEIIHHDSLLSADDQAIIYCETNKPANEIGNYFITEEFEENPYLRTIIISWLEAIKDKNAKIHSKLAISWDGHGRDNRHMYDDYKCFFLDILESMLNHVLKWNKSQKLQFKSAHLMFKSFSMDGDVIDNAELEENNDNKVEDENVSKLEINVKDSYLNKEDKESLQSDKDRVDVHVVDTAKFDENNDIKLEIGCVDGHVVDTAKFTDNNEDTWKDNKLMVC